MEPLSRLGTSKKSTTAKPRVLTADTFAADTLAKTNLLRMRQEIPLSEPELAAVEDGLAAYERLIVNLRDVPTPDHLVQIEAAPTTHTIESEQQC
ncbi:MAG: hypothetical protein JWQ49_3603 [Edaphobacter sp.]|nr:hypothetical protein [Edaphobacter sp.]